MTEQNTQEEQTAETEENSSEEQANQVEENNSTENQQQQQQETGNEGTPWDDPAKAKAEIERLRRENANERVNAKKSAADEARKDLLKEFQKLVNPEAADGGNLTVEDLNKELTRERENARLAALELQVYREASHDKLNAERILNSRSFFNKTKDLDPKSDDFGSKLAEVIQAEVKNDPTLKLTGGVQTSGAEQHGGSGEPQQSVTKEQFAQMTVEQRTDLFRKNRALYDQLVAD